MNPIPGRLPSRPLRHWFLAWHIHTGDPAKVIAKGFDLDLEIVADFLSGDAPLMVSAKVGLDICHRIRVEPSELWREAGRAPAGRSVPADAPWADLSPHWS